MRLATYNVAWFDRLFDEESHPALSDEAAFRKDVTKAEQWRAAGRVFQALDADAVMVVEAPNTAHSRSTAKALQRFAKAFSLRSTAVAHGVPNGTQQEIALLYDPAKLTVEISPLSLGAPGFEGVFEIDLDIDDVADQVRFSKPPLELAVTLPSGPRFRMIGTHLKSKAPHGAASADEAMQIAIANRRKQLAQAIWLRARIEAVIAQGDGLIVLGDLNDGPGLDAYERLFGRSSVEVVIGANPPQLFDPHAMRALRRRLEASPTTSRFFLYQEQRWLQALLDYILVSEPLQAHADRWRIWHPFDDATCFANSQLREALLTASDHFPVSLDLRFG